LSGAATTAQCSLCGTEHRKRRLPDIRDGSGRYKARIQFSQQRSSILDCRWYESNVAAGLGAFLAHESPKLRVVVAGTSFGGTVQIPVIQTHPRTQVVAVSSGRLE